MLAGEEENFPRGGTIVRKRTARETESLFNVSKPTKPKKSKKSKKKDQKEAREDTQSIFNIRGSLSYNKIQTGMVVLGCIRHITNFSINVELPGLCFATVNITEISDPFTKYLNIQLENNEPDTTSLLTKIFSVGQYLPVKITNTEAREKGIHVEASINPREIYSEHSLDSFKKGMLVWFCVKSESDHGYDVSLGKKDCRAFLPFKNVDKDLKYITGQPLWGAIHKSDVTATSCILRISAKSEHIRETTSEIENLHAVIPGMKVKFMTDKISSYGIQGQFGENFIGYIDESHLDKPLKKLSDFNEGHLLTAYVLFLEPATKITHLTLRNLETQKRPNLNTGDVVLGEVYGKTHNGVFFMLPNKLKGFATNHRLIKTLPKKDHININEAINSKYSIGSHHKCRIMDYNHITNVFICTPELGIVKEDTFKPSDLTVGEQVNLKLVEIKPEGFVVTTGHIRGFIPNLHITNAPCTDKIKKKFKEGQKLNARVLSVEGEKVLFTAKPMLVDNEECLTKLEDGEVGKKYTGVIAKVTNQGALVVFYGNAKGWISQKGMGKQATNPSDFFFIGQVVSVFVWKNEGDKLSLCLFKPQITKPAIQTIGGKFSGIVSSLNEDGILVKIQNSNRTGVVPNNHLSACLSLCGSIKTTFKEGDKMPDLMYVGGESPKIFSRREALAMKNKSVCSLKDLKVGSIIRCSYDSSSDDGVYVIPLIKDYWEKIFVSQKDIHDDLVPNFEPFQSLMAKVQVLNVETREIVLSLKLQDVFVENVETVVGNFTRFLFDLSYLRSYSKKQKLEIYRYKLGYQVTCAVTKVGAQGGCAVVLPNGCKGLCPASLCPKNVKEGDSLVGMVLYHNFEKNYVEVCLKPDVAGRINAKQNGELISTVTASIADTILVKDECILAVLKHPEANKQLIYLPVKLHENDFEGCLDYYKGKKFKICVCGKLKKNLIGLGKKLFIRLDKRTQYVPNSEEVVKKKAKNVKKKQNVLVQSASESDSGIEQNAEDAENEEEVLSEKEVDLDEEEEPKKKEVAATSALKTLPGVSSFFNSTKRSASVEDSSSDEEDAEKTVTKKKKLTPAERVDLIRQEEERLSKIEKELADPTKPLESAHQFDRLVTANPNSSQLWAQYISFHVAATEIDKARAVAKRALESINMTMTDDKFNIWIILLNLENMFGTKESFDSTLTDALKFNDSLKVYLKAVQMLAESGKFLEMEEKINRLRPKHKQDLSMWLELGKIYYEIGKFREARNCKDSALKSINDKKSQLTLIVRYAIMEFKYGEEDQGSAIFEAILTSDPRKVNIWITYVDQLVKKGQIEQARLVLERSVCQRLPLKSMRSLFMKFRKFEEEHGSEATVEAVKQRAQDYIAKFDK